MKRTAAAASAAAPPLANAPPSKQPKVDPRQKNSPPPLLLLMPPSAHARRELGGVSSSRVHAMVERLRAMGAVVVESHDQMQELLKQWPASQHPPALAVAGEQDALDVAVVPGDVVLQALRSSSLEPLQTFYMAVGKRSRHQEREIEELERRRQHLDAGGYEYAELDDDKAALQSVLMPAHIKAEDRDPGLISPSADDRVKTTEPTDHDRTSANVAGPAAVANDKIKQERVDVRLGEATAVKPSTAPLMTTAMWIRNTHPALLAPEGSPARTYACFWPAPIFHANKALTDALETVEEQRAAKRAMTREHYRDLAHGPLAFRRASCSIKALNFKITQVSQLYDIPFVGGRSLAVLRDVLEGRGLDAYLQQDLSTIIEFKQIFGVGTVTAWQWYDFGYRSLDQVRQAVLDGRLAANSQITASLRYWDEVKQGVTPAETETLCVAVLNSARRAVAEKFGPEVAAGLYLQAVGGYRRGKPHTKDVDIILWHPTVPEVAPNLLDILVARLIKKGRIIWNQTHKFHNNASNRLTANVRRDFEGSHGFDMDANVMDLHDKDLTIMRLPGSGRATRVDLIVTRADQYAFCLLGWTGSKMYNRELRRYAKTELGLIISSEALVDYSSPPRPGTVWDPQSRVWKIECKTEEDIFRTIGVPIFPLELRNH